MPKPSLQHFYTARDGQRWRVFDWQLVTGHRYPRHLGEPGASHRGFLNLETGEKRVYQFGADAESRWPVSKFLEAQLAHGCDAPGEITGDWKSPVVGVNPYRGRGHDEDEADVRPERAG